jgi:hypothetical protein
VRFYHARQLQNLALVLAGGLESHLCLALKLFLRAGIDFLIVILGSPYRTTFSLPPEQALTTNFLLAPGVRLGELQGRSRGFIVMRWLGS